MKEYVFIHTDVYITRWKEPNKVVCEFTNISEYRDKLEHLIHKAYPDHQIDSYPMVMSINEGNGLIVANTDSEYFECIGIEVRGGLSLEKHDDNYQAFLDEVIEIVENKKTIDRYLLSQREIDDIIVMIIQYYQKVLGNKTLDEFKHELTVQEVNHYTYLKILDENLRPGALHYIQMGYRNIYSWLQQLADLVNHKDLEKLLNSRCIKEYFGAIKGSEFIISSMKDEFNHAKALYDFKHGK